MTKKLQVDWRPQHFLPSFIFPKLSVFLSVYLFLLSLVYLFIGEHIALVDFVKALHGLKVLGNGDYMIISIDDFIFDPDSNAQEYTSRSKLFIHGEFE